MNKLRPSGGSSCTTGAFGAPRQPAPPRHTTARNPVRAERPVADTGGRHSTCSTDGTARDGGHITWRRGDLEGRALRHPGRPGSSDGAVGLDLPVHTASRAYRAGVRLRKQRYARLHPNTHGRTETVRQRPSVSASFRWIVKWPLWKGTRRRRARREERLAALDRLHIRPMRQFHTVFQ